jgi:hypothetical protein
MVMVVVVVVMFAGAALTGRVSARSTAGLAVMAAA